jgi:uncharacterized membrane protein
MENLENYVGIIPIFVGVYLLLIAFKIKPRKADLAEKWKSWDKKYGLIAKIAGPIMILYGVIDLIGVV